MKRLAAALVLLGVAGCSAQPGAPVCEAPKVLVDIGHSEANPGAISAAGVGEFTFNRRFAARLVEALHRGGMQAFPLTVRGDDPRLDRRVASISKASPDLVLSIHHDSVQARYLKTRTVAGLEQSYTDAASGFSLFVPADTPVASASIAAARPIADALIARGQRPSLHHAEPIEGEHRRLLDPARGIYAGDFLKILRTAEVPAVLIEVGVIKNPADEERLSDPRTIIDLAAGVAEAVAASRCTLTSGRATRTSG